MVQSINLLRISDTPMAYSIDIISCITERFMDRVFRRFGLSGKSFIPMLIGTGCGVPGIMASRTIENDRDRKMTIMTTTFIPCGAKLPIIALIAGALFDGAAWVAPSAYFVGIAAIICSGIILKKTKMFAGDPAPFVMELPAYHMPTVTNVLRSMWERGWSFIKKAGTIILLSTIVLWFLMSFVSFYYFVSSFICFAIPSQSKSVDLIASTMSCNSEVGILEALLTFMIPSFSHSAKSSSLSFESSFIR